MGFLDKVKNMFTEEVEDDDVKVEQIKHEVTQVAIESPNAKVRDFDEEEDTFEEEPIEKINKPVFFDDNDFRDLNLIPKEEKKEKIEEKEIYRSKALIEKEPEEKKAFKPTPIISPVYGVLDKNYHKEDIVSRTDTKGVDRELDSIDTIRNKAYGTLEDELENTLFGTNSILFKQDETEKEEDPKIAEVDDDILSNLTDDISKELDELLIRKEKYSDDEIKDTMKKSDDFNEEDLLGFIDSTLYKEGAEE